MRDKEGREGMRDKEVREEWNEGQGRKGGME